MRWPWQRETPEVERERLVDEYAELTVAWYAATFDKPDPWRAAQLQGKLNGVWKRLIERHGDAGREAMLRLLRHDDRGVQVSVASRLLRYHTEAAMEVLQAIRKYGGRYGLIASNNIANWEKGRWEE